MVGTAFAVTMPILYWRWGHLASSAQFLIPGALALYLCTLRMPDRRRFTVLWAAYLVLTLSFNNYLLVMAGAVFAAALAQRWYNQVDDSRACTLMAASVGATVLVFMYVYGFIGGAIRQLTSFGFGYFSMNLLAPVYPQDSSVFAEFNGVLDATGGQYEGYAYLGAGLLLATVINLPLLWRWLLASGKRHVMLLVVLAGSCALAVSNRIFFGDTLIFELPLHKYVVGALSVFRASARFFWLPEYALLCTILVLGLRFVGRHRRCVAMIWFVLVLAGLQFFDTGSLRRAIAANLWQPHPVALDRTTLDKLVGQAQAIRVYPSFACIRHGNRPLYRHANVELQMAGAQRLIPINSFFHARPNKDCEKEDRERATEALRSGVLYVYLDGKGPGAAQIPGVMSAQFCGKLDWAQYCLMPAPDL